MSITFPTTPWMFFNGNVSMAHVNLRYDPNEDPYAVALIFPVEDGAPIFWLLGRDLLREGLDGTAGSPYGDVKVVPGFATVGVHLMNPSGRAILLFDRNELTQFVKSVYLQCPEGRESARLDWSDLPKVIA